jgi:hypothetical protein
MTTENRISSSLGNSSVNTPVEVNARINRRAVFSVINAELVATQRCGKRNSAVNQHATIEEAVWSVGAATRPYNEDIR